MPDFTVVTSADFQDGPQNATDLVAGDPPIEIGNAVVGGSQPSGIFSDYEKVEFGAPPDAPGRDEQGNEVFIDLQRPAVGGVNAQQVPDTAQVRFVVHRRNDSDGPNLSPYIRTRQSNNTTDAGVRPTLDQGGTRATDGRIVAWQVRDQANGGYNVSRFHSELEVPITGYDKGEA